MQLSTDWPCFGIITAVAVPSYQKYAAQARLAEAYVGLDSIKKLQVTNFSEYKFFVDGFILGAFEETGTYIKSGGSKFKLGYHSALIPEALKAISYFGLPFPIGTLSYFSYQTRAGFRDSDNNPIVYIFQPDGTIGFGGYGSEEVYEQSQVAGLKTSGGAKCDLNFDLNEMGLDAPNRHWAILFAIGDFKNEPANLCTWIFQKMSAETEISVGPINQLTIGE